MIIDFKSCTVPISILCLHFQYNPSGGNSDSDGARGGGRKALARGGRGGRPARKTWKKNSDSEDDFDLSDADSDVRANSLSFDT